MSVRTFGIASKTDSAEDYRMTQVGLYVPASALNVRTGSLAAPTLTGTGAFTCQISPCSVVIDGTSNSLQAGYAAALDLAATVTISPANSQARVDLICLQIQDNAYDGSGQYRGQVLYIAGTPGGGVPSTPTTAIPLFTVPVPANASSVNFSAATAVFPFTAASGGIVPVRSAADRPAVANAVQYRHRLDGSAGGTSPLEWSVDGLTWTPVYDAATLGNAFVCTSTTRPANAPLGKVVYESDTGRFSVYNGAAWVPTFDPAPTWTSLGNPVLPFTGTVYAAKTANLMIYKGLLFCGSGFPSQNSMFNLFTSVPPAAQPGRTCTVGVGIVANGGAPSATLYLNGATVSLAYQSASNPTNGNIFFDGVTVAL